MLRTPIGHKGVQVEPGAWGGGHHHYLDVELYHCTFSIHI